MQSPRGWSAERIRAAIRSEHHAGVNPASPNPEKTTVTFREVAEVWFERKRAGLKNGKHIDQNWNTMVAYAFPTLGSRPISEIARLEVGEALRPIWHSTNETARRTLGRIREVFEVAKLEHDVGISPADFDPRVAYGHVRRRTRHFGALVWEQVPEFWAWLQEAPCDEQTRQFVMLLVLSARRTGEVRFACPGFRNARASTWTTPAELMKRGREHRVPLSPQAEIVWENALLLTRDPAFVFGKPRNRSGVICENTALKLVKGFDPSDHRTWVPVELQGLDAGAAPPCARRHRVCACAPSAAARRGLSSGGPSHRAKDPHAGPGGLRDSWKSAGPLA